MIGRDDKLNRGDIFQHDNSGNTYHVMAEVKLKVDGTWIDGVLYAPCGWNASKEDIFVRTRYDFRQKFSVVKCGDTPA